MPYPLVPKLYSSKAFDQVKYQLSLVGVQAKLVPSVEFRNLAGFFEEAVIRRGMVLYGPESDYRGVIHEMQHLALVPPLYRQSAPNDLGHGFWDKIGFIPGVLRGNGNQWVSADQELLLYDLTAVMMHRLGLKPHDFIHEGFHLYRATTSPMWEDLQNKHKPRLYLETFRQHSNLLDPLVESK